MSSVLAPGFGGHLARMLSPPRPPVITQAGIQVDVRSLPHGACLLTTHMIGSTVTPPFLVSLSAEDTALLAQRLTQLEAGGVGAATVRHYTDTPPEVALVLDLAHDHQRRHLHLTPAEAQAIAALLRGN